MRVDYTSKDALECASLDEHEEIDPSTTDRRTRGIRIDYTHLQRALECVRIAENENGDDENEDVEMKE